MIYKKFYFKNYKGIKETEIVVDECSRLHCIIGRNDSGKTTILKGIRDSVNILVTGSLGRKDEYEHGITDCIDFSTRSFSGDIRFGIEFELEEQNIKTFNLKRNDKILYFEFIYHFVDGALRDMSATEENVYLVKHNRKTKIENGINIINTIRQEYQNGHHIICPAVYYYSDFFTKIPEKIYFHASDCNKPSEEDKELNDKWRGLLNSVLRSVTNKNDTSFDKLVEDHFNKPNVDPRDLKKHLNDVNYALSQQIVKTWKDNKIFQEDISDIASVEIDLQFEKKSEISLSILLKNELNEESPLKDKSLGFKWYFTFLLFTLYRKSKNVLFLLDEPASNLYADIQEIFFDIFQKLVGNDIDSNQYAYMIYSTHSHYLYDDCIKNSTHVTIRTKKDGIICKKANEIKEKETQLCLRVINDYRKCQLQFIPMDKSVFVEGKEDYVLLKIFLHFLLKQDNYYFYYGSGSGGLLLPVKSAICYNKSYLAIFDNDNGGDDGMNNLKNNLGNLFEQQNCKKISIFLNNDKFADFEDLIEINDKRILAEIAKTKWLENNRNAVKKSVVNACLELYVQIAIRKNNKILEQLNQQLSQQTKDNFTKLADAIENHFNLK